MSFMKLLEKNTLLKSYKKYYEVLLYEKIAEEKHEKRITLEGKKAFFLKKIIKENKYDAIIRVC